MARPNLDIVTLDFNSVDPAVNPNTIIDIAQALCVYNRKSYRSGYIYSVDFIEYIGSAGDVISIAKIPTTYCMIGAYRLGYELWKDQRHAAIDETGVLPGKWSDFKPFYNQDHFDGTLTELPPTGVGPGFVMQILDQTGAEWNRAEIQVNDVGAATTFEATIGMLGDDDLAAVPGPYISLFEGYGDTRAATLAPDPLNPHVASSSWAVRTGEQSGEMARDVVDMIERENDFPPYANQIDPALAPTYVGNSQSATHGILMDRAVTGTTGRAVSLDGGLVPLGLLLIQQAGDGGGIIRVHCSRGTYKGVAAKKIGDFS